MKHKQKLLNLYETANRLQLPPGWLRDAALAGTIPCLLIGKRKLRFELHATKQAIAKLAAQGKSHKIKNQGGTDE